MAYSLKEINWVQLNERVREYRGALEYIPIPVSENHPKNGLGISISTFKKTDGTWSEIEAVLSLLIKDFKMKVIDLYSGQEITLQNMNDLYQTLYG